MWKFVIKISIIYIRVKIFMANFFSKIGNIEFEMFGWTHLAIIAITIVLIVLLVLFKDKLKKWNKKEKIRYIFAAILFLNMLIYYMSLIITKQFDYTTDLPLHLCYITNFFMMYILISGNRKLYKIIYFFTFIGPLPSIIWSDLAVSYDRFIFYQFIISHHIMLLSSLYLLLVLDYVVEAKYIFPTIIIGNAFVILMAIFNYFVGSNYVMLTSLPTNVVNIYPWLNVLPAPVWLELIGIIAILISYIPAYLKNKKVRGIDKCGIIELHNTFFKIYKYEWRIVQT